MTAIRANVHKNEFSGIATQAFSKCLAIDPSFFAYNSEEYTVFPGFCDVHVHFREPGFYYKETIRTGSLAAAHGGYTAVCTMPNLNPVPDCRSNLSLQLSIINIDSVINIYPYGAVTVGEKGEKLSDMESMAGKVAAFSDDGRGVQSAEIMKEAMLKAKSLGKIIAAHCEDNSLLFGGYIHDGAYCRSHGHKGISSESEWKQVERDLDLAAQTGCAYHVCHVSCKESVELVRQAKKAGLNVSCETAPHYLLLDENDISEDGRFKMNPPLRAESDRLALIEGVCDGTIEIVATDHAPHSAKEKSKGLADSAFGVVGLETAFPSLYTGLVKTGVISLDKLIDLICVNPRKRFGLKPEKGFTVWDLNEEYTVDPGEFLSKGRATPFEGKKLYGKCHATVLNGETAYKG